MIQVIGKKNCSACSMTKTVLINKGIEFTYKLFDDLSKEEQEEILQMANRFNTTTMPLIIKNKKILNLQEVIA